MSAYVLPLLGGLLIGGAAALLLLFRGRIMGVSGITWGALTEGRAGYWRVLFLAGLLGGVVLFHLSTGWPVPQYTPHGMQAIIAGLLVGIGTKLGSGCTSGHGVCGLPRLSLRSFVAVMTFMTTGIVTVALVRHVF